MAATSEINGFTRVGTAMVAISAYGLIIALAPDPARWWMWGAAMIGWWGRVLIGWGWGLNR